MDPLQILAIINAAAKLTATGIDILNKMSDPDIADPTPEEISDLQKKQADVEAQWQATLKKMREAEESE